MSGSDPRAIARFVEAWLDERGETVEHFSERSGLNASGLYQMLRGERQYLQAPTLDKIALAMNMSTAELLRAAGVGPVDADPDEATLLSHYRAIAPHKRATALEIVAALRDKVQPSTHANRRRDARAKRFLEEQAKLERPDADDSPPPSDSRYAEYYPGFAARHAGRIAPLEPVLAR